MNKILLIGPFPKPISGVSLANKVVKEILDDSKDYKVDFINTSYPVFEDVVGSFSFKKILFFLNINFNVFKVFKNNIIYLTPGQTFFGITKYFSFILLSSLLRKELIIHVHGNYLGTQYSQLSFFKKKIFYFLLSKFTKGIVLSKSLIKNLTPFLKPERIFILNNFAQDYLYNSNTEKKTTALRICYLSNLMEEKGIIYLLDTLEALEKNNVSYKAKIAGNIDESLTELILNKINKLKHTIYLGVVYKEDKKKLLNWSTIFILPTFYKMEGQPIAILEALATGNVIISTKHAGIPDIIEDKINGFLIPTKSTDSLLNALVFLDKNKLVTSKISIHNKIYFNKNFTINIFKKEFLKIIAKKCKN